MSKSVTNREIERQIAELAIAAIDKSKEPNTIVNRLERYAAKHMRSLALGSAAGIIGIVALSVGGPSPKPQSADDGLIVGSISSPASPQANWVALQKPMQLLNLEASQLTSTKQSYEAFKSDAGAQRDVMRWRSDHSKQTDMAISLYRNVRGMEASSLLIETIRSQAEQGRSVAKAGQPDAVKTKFGMMETLDVHVTGSQNDTRACLAFRSSTISAPIRLSGWYCPAEGRVADRPELSCLIDKVVLLKSGQDTGLRQFFVQAERARPSTCPSQRNVAGSRQSWLDSHARIPEMRSDLGTGDETARTSGRKK